jgi:uncharacterized membrane protein YbhN (UPF0104 family)
MKGSGMRRRLAGRCIVAIAALALAATVVRLGGAGAPVRHTLLALGRLRPETISFAVALSVLSMLISGAMWSRLLLRLGFRLPLRVGLAAYLSAGLAGYVVNAAGPALGCAVSLRRHGMCPGRAVLLALIANALGFCGVLVWVPVGILLLARSGMSGALPVVGRHGTTAEVVALVGIWIGMLATLTVLASASGSGNRLARLLLGRVPRIEGVPVAMRPRHLLALIPWSAASWLAGAGALYVILAALNPGRDLNIGDVVGSAVLAAALGSMAFFVPEGVGVGDGALVALLAHATGLPVAQCAAAAIAARALDPLTKLGMLVALACTANPLVARPVSRARGWLWARWPHRPAHPTLLLPWYVWRFAFEEVRS